ncbi:hypothetical protein D9M68_759710 [compost metagenome]
MAIEAISLKAGIEAEQATLAGMRTVTTVQARDDPLPQAGVIQPFCCLRGIAATAQIENPDGSGWRAIDPNRVAIAAKLFRLNAQFGGYCFPQRHGNRIAGDVIVQQFAVGGGTQYQLQRIGQAVMAEVDALLDLPAVLAAGADVFPVVVLAAAQTSVLCLLAENGR